jgi:putative membrane protein
MKPAASRQDMDGTMRKRSIVKGALAGFAGGLVGAAAKAYLDGFYASRLANAQVPPALLEPSLTATTSTVSLEISPWVFGGMAGAAYGAAVEMEPSTSTWQGAAFGFAVDRFTRFRASTFESLGAAEAAQAKIGRRVSFAVFGVVTEIVRRTVRRSLD